MRILRVKIYLIYTSQPSLFGKRPQERNLRAGAFHDTDRGRDPKEDDIRWASRCFHRAYELYT